jgi:hypothetical protein
LFLIGNNNFDGTGFTGQGSVPQLNFRNESTYQHFGFAPTLISVGSTSADSVCSCQFSGWGNRIVIEANNSVYNTTFYNWHLMTWDYEYMPDSATLDKNNIGSTSRGEQGPGFASIFGRLALKRRFLRNHYVDYRTSGRPENRSGCVGSFGRWTRSYGSNTGGYRFTSVTISNSTFQNNAPPSTGAVDSVPSGQIYEYLDKNTPLRRNATGDPSISEPTTEAPEIIGDSYTFGAAGNYLNLKYIKAKEGLDYENNMQSNRTLYG